MTGIGLTAIGLTGSHIGGQIQQCEAVCTIALEVVAAQQPEVRFTEHTQTSFEDHDLNLVDVIEERRLFGIREQDHFFFNAPTGDSLNVAFFEDSIALPKNPEGAPVSVYLGFGTRAV